MDGEFDGLFRSGVALATRLDGDRLGGRGIGACKLNKTGACLGGGDMGHGSVRSVILSNEISGQTAMFGGMCGIRGVQPPFDGGSCFFELDCGDTEFRDSSCKACWNYCALTKRNKV